MSTHVAMYHRGERVPLAAVLAAANRFRTRRGARALRRFLIERFNAETANEIPRQQWAAVIAALEEGE